ncbi:MAG: peptidase inhibitor family I36 protein [Acidimicrobiia bacterium]
MVAAAGAALPALADSNCDSGELCIWGSTNYSGDFWDPPPAIRIGRVVEARACRTTTTR